MNNAEYYINVDESVLRAWTLSYANRSNFIVLPFNGERKALWDHRNILHGHRESRASIEHSRSIFKRARVWSFTTPPNLHGRHSVWLKITLKKHRHNLIRNWPIFSSKKQRCRQLIIIKLWYGGYYKINPSTSKFITRALFYILLLNHYIICYNKS